MLKEYNYWIKQRIEQNNYFKIFAYFTRKKWNKVKISKNWFCKIIRFLFFCL